MDLVFEEAAVNDDTNGFSDVEQVRGMEGIVRQALLSNPNMDVVLLHFVDPGKMTEIRKGKTPSVIVNHERVAEHYHIPSINLAREVTERIHASEFNWDNDFRDLHPSSQEFAWEHVLLSGNTMARILPRVMTPPR